jgi:hypothetical protein
VSEKTQQMPNDKLKNSAVADLHVARSRHVERGDTPGIVTLVGPSGEADAMRSVRSSLAHRCVNGKRGGEASYVP